MQALKTSLNIAMILMLLGTEAYGGWVDTWVAQRQSTPAGSFEGQKRGYMTGGSFDARWRTGTDSFWSVQAPTFKAGCGGISANLGALSYMNFDAIVEKMQSILQNGAGVAFDLAMQTLCQPCSQAMKSFTAMVDQFNNMQINDCDAGKALVATVQYATSSDDAAKENYLKTMNQGVVGGASQWWTGLKKSAEGFGSDARALGNHVAGLLPSSGTGTGTPGTTTDPGLSGCPANLKAILPDKDATNDTFKSVVKEAAALRGITDADLVGMLRAMTGDVVIWNQGGNLKAKLEPPCGEQSLADFEQFITGKAVQKKMDDAGKMSCPPVGDTNKNLLEYVQKQMEGIATKMKGKGELTPTEEAFLNSSPLGLAQTLKVAIGTRHEAATIVTLSKVTATSYAFYMLGDIYGTTTDILNTAGVVLADTVNKPDCDIKPIEASLKNEMVEMKGRILKSMELMNIKYAASIAEVQMVYNFLDSLKQLQNDFHSKIAQSFGSTVAGRVMNR